MDYDQAKEAFFQELQYPEEELTNHICAMADIICSDLHSTYLSKGFDGEIQKALGQVIGTMGQAQEVARTLELPTQEKKYKDWQAQVMELFSEVAGHYTLAHIQLPILSGGKRQTKHFFETKLPIDSAIIAIESALDNLYQGEIIRERRDYHAAGLLYYLGYEKYEGPIPAGAPFPDKLIQENEIHNRYRSRRREAKKYLSREWVADLMQQAMSTVVASENQRLLSNALLPKLWRK